MKTKLPLIQPAALLALLATLIGQPAASFAQGTAFTYQGRLNDGANPANGKYDLTFGVWTNSSGPAEVGSNITNLAVGVTNGLFAVVLDFGAGIFTGPARWLEIGVRTNGSLGAYTTLAPRQALSATPYAIQAGDAGTLGGQSATAYVARAGDTMTGDLNLSAPAGAHFGFNTRQMLDLYDITYGIGVQNYTLYERTAATGGFAWYAGGIHSDAQNDPGPGGTSLMTLNPSGSLSLTGDANIGNNVSAYNSFYLGDLITGSSGEFVIYGPRVFPNFAPVRFAIDPAGGVTVRSNLFFGTQTRQMLNLWSTAYGVGVQNNAEYFRTANEFFWYKGGTHSDTFADPGAGGTPLMRLGNAGTLIVSGSIETPVLTITGGADVAEPFKMSSAAIPPGAVVIIDEENPGELKLSHRAYDRRVAGIVSGANGIQPGISLSQQALNEGGRNVALSGRVYVLADASGSPIKPGDLLTTSKTPGHAMKVTNYAKAQGAILGKAMSSLPQGKGMVLVLVTLQ